MGRKHLQKSSEYLSFIESSVIYGSEVWTLSNFIKENKWSKIVMDNIRNEDIIQQMKVTERLTGLIENKQRKDASKKR